MQRGSHCCFDTQDLRSLGKTHPLFIPLLLLVVFVLLYYILEKKNVLEPGVARTFLS